MTAKMEISINIGKGKVKANYVIVSKDEDGVISSYMPGYDIYYSSPTMEIAHERGNLIIHNFLNFWIEKQSWKKFVIKVHGLGFRTKNHNLKMKNFLNRRPERAGFTPSVLKKESEIFNGDKGKISRASSNLELAI